METTTKEETMKARPLTEISNEIALENIRRNYEARVDRARNADISVENRNLSLAWSFRRLRLVK